MTNEESSRQACRRTQFKSYPVISVLTIAVEQYTLGTDISDRESRVY